MGRGFTERATVQNPLVKYAVEVDWLPVDQEEALALRESEAGLFFYQVLRDQLLALNPGVITKTNVDEIIRRLEAVQNSIEGNEEILLWLRGQRSVHVDERRQEINVTVVDFEQLERNVFHVTEEWDYTNGKFRNRADVVFLINGIPVAVVETKAAHKPDGIDRGFAQIRRYHIETPEIMTAPQVFDVTHLINFYYGATWSLDLRNLFNWKDEEPGNFERKVKRFFARDRILGVLRDYIAFIRKDDQLSKVVLRQHQVRAVEKVVVRVRDRQKRRGLIWHTQGSGKTLTMITVAHQLLTRPEFEKPTVVMLVDRNELESQLFTNLHAYGLRDVVVADSKRKIQRVLKSGYRGLILSMIHKFDGMAQDLNTSDRIIVLVDEAHRTTGGDLGNYLMAALPNATYIGFTGTPIDKTAYGKGTFKVFGVDDPQQGYLDKYSIAESIADGTTVPLHYSLAPSEMRVPTETLEKEFLNLVEAQGISDIEDLNRILDRAVNLKAFLKSTERVERVAKFMAQHYKTSVEPLGYKAFLVGVDREACVLYKEALDKYLPADYSVPVYTPAQNDGLDLKRHYLNEVEEKNVRKAFLKPGLSPRILIVTEKLLTGFDAPILYCMYLDKPMRDHALLQAIARVNRPYELEGQIRKPAGFILDFVGIFDKLERALAFDSEEVSSVIQNIDVLKARFKELMEGKSRDYLALAGGPQDDKAVEGIVERFVDKEERERFSAFFHEVETLYEIISPDAYLADYIEPYQQLAVLYEIVRTAFDVRSTPVKDLMNKTEALVRRHVTADGLQATLPVYEINEKTLEALREEGESSPSKVVNLARSLAEAVKERQDEQPHLIPIAERAAHVLELFEERQLNTAQALRELAKAIEEYNAAQREMRERGFDIRTFSLYWILRRASVTDAPTVALALEAAFQRLPNHHENPEERRELRAELHRLLLRKIEREKRAGVVDELLRVRKP